jgi:thioredoxin reductase (NADPH)
MKNKLITKVALIGGGPACATAAMQLIRAGIDIILVTIILEEVLTVEQVSSGYTIKTAETEIHSEYLIVGTGSIPKKLEVEGEKESFLNRKLFYEMYNAKQFADKKDIGIIGSGDVAYDYALNLQNVANKISIIRRTDKTSSLPILQKRVKNTDNIVLLNDYVIKKVELKDDKISLEMDVDGKLITMIKDLVLVAIGRKPNYDFLSEGIITEYNNPKSDSKIYLIGDVNKNNFRQVSIAMGDGMKVAMEIVKEVALEERYHGASRKVW